MLFYALLQYSEPTSYGCVVFTQLHEGNTQKMITQLKQQVIQRVSYLAQVIEQNTGQQAPLPRIKYVSRGTNAGLANNLSWTLTFNQILLCDNPATFVENTVAHEYAHLITGHIHGIQQFPHGLKWQKIMKLFNVTPRVTHDYDVSKLLNKARIWLCACQSHYVSNHLAKQLHNGNQYQCGSCGVTIHQTV